jgi:hypothetical protein
LTWSWRRRERKRERKRRGSEEIRNGRGEMIKECYQRSSALVESPNRKGWFTFWTLSRSKCRLLSDT